MAIVDENTLMFYKSWDQAWTSLSTDIPFVDLVYHNDGQFLALCASGKILVVSFEGHSHSTSEIKPEFEDLAHLFRNANAVSGMVIKHYLVSSSEQLLEVIRIGRIEDKETIGFMVFKLDWSSKSLISVNHLDDNVLFVSDNYSASRKTSQIPGSRENCIYFTDLHCGIHGVFHVMAAYYLQDMSKESLVRHTSRLHHGGRFIPNNAFWITPSLS